MFIPFKTYTFHIILASLFRAWILHRFFIDFGMDFDVIFDVFLHDFLEGVFIDFLSPTHMEHTHTHSHGGMHFFATYFATLFTTGRLFDAFGSHTLAHFWCTFWLCLVHTHTHSLAHIYMASIYIYTSYFYTYVFELYKHHLSI